VALGIRENGKKEIIDFRQAASESQSAWEGFLNSLYHRGLIGSKLKLIPTDGGSGLRATLPLIYGFVPIQRCWAHKTRNVLNQVKKIDQPAVKKDLHRISHAKTALCAQRAAKQFAVKWQQRYPKSVFCLLSDPPELLSFFKADLPLRAEELRTINAIERRFREVRRRTRPMGTFSDPTSIDRILFAVFTYENHQQKSATPFLLTHNS
jgi:transposase-like protein